MQKLGLAIKMLESLIPLLGSQSEAGKDVLKSLNSLSRHVPSGTTTPATERTGIQNMAMQNAQNSQALKSMQKPPAAQPGQAA